ncbi:TfpX/TfpZ family type IV pilin accessory protein [Acinetobacter nematophilus]|uniref:TfpX/TfpZ family type IV pilin accessory protein n=1 Tax=Acinetobacter nematophilus TaxID=2994642 RepID=UPI003AF53B54
MKKIGSPVFFVIKKFKYLRNLKMKSKRLKYFTIHLFISIIITLIVMGAIFLIWYPLPLPKAVGVTHIFLIFIGIDLLVGPLLGLIIFKEGKKNLNLDLAFIIFIQFSALSYGVYTIAEGRPAWIVFNVDHFDVVRKNQIIEDNIHQAQVRYQKVSLFKPEFVAIEQSKDIDQMTNYFLLETLEGINLAQFPERYIPFIRGKSQIQQKSHEIKLLTKFNTQQDIQNTLKKYPQATAWLPLKADAVDMVVLINREKGEVVEIVDLRPWK